MSLAALAFSGVERIKAPFGRPAVETIHVANTNAFRAPEGDDEDALCRRLLAEIEGVVAAEGPDTVAGERRRGDHPAARLLAGRARAVRPPRDPARLR